MRTPSVFLKMGANPTAIWLSDIQQTAGGAADLILCTYNDNVSRTAMYIYINAEEAAVAELASAGWYQLDDEFNPIPDEVKDFELPFGQGCVIVSGSSDAAYTSKGVVDSIKREFSVTENTSKMTGNVLPHSIMLSDLKQTAGGAADLILCTYNDNVSRTAMYIYINAEEAAVAGLASAGWYQLDDEFNPIPDEVKDFELPSGQGFVVVSGNSDAVLQFPSAM